MSDDGDEAEGEAAEHDKEVGNSHLVSAGVVVTVVSVVEVSVLHPAKTISSYSRL